MKVSRPSLLVPWIALCLLARVALGPGDAAPPGPQVLPRASAANLCGAHGCGCPHEAVPVSCCCAEDDATAPQHAVPRAAPLLRRPDPRTIDEARRPARLDVAAGMPDATLVSFECSGPKPERTAARAGTMPVALPAAALVLASDEGPSFALPAESGPPFDLGTEPPALPPRRAVQG